MSARKVAVTGFGVVGPLGRGYDENSAALKAGKSGVVSMRPLWEEKGLRSHVGGNVPAAPLRKEFDRKKNRFLSDAALLAAISLKDAIVHAGLSDEEVKDPRTGIVLGTGAGSSILDAIALGARVEERGGAKVGAFQVPLIMGSSVTANAGSIFGIHGHSYAVTSACSTSAHAMMIGLDLIRSGRQDRVFAGGSEDINVVSAAAFDGMHALSSNYNDEPKRASRPLDQNRDGFVFSGGGGTVVLENMEFAKARGAKIWAVLEGAAATCDGEDMVVPNGIGGESAMRLALEDAGITAERTDYINLHGTSTPAGDIREVESIQRVFGAKVPAFSSTKSMTGHGLGAAGSLEAIYCIIMMNDNSWRLTLIWKTPNRS
jgi:3-oxoacyl-[acyl-carrier-protein] synthase-1